MLYESYSEHTSKIRGSLVTMLSESNLFDSGLLDPTYRTLISQTQFAEQFLDPSKGPVNRSSIVYGHFRLKNLVNLFIFEQTQQLGAVNFKKSHYNGVPHIYCSLSIFTFVKLLELNSKLCGTSSMSP